MQLPKIISFYTQDWVYPDHARRLARECQALGLEYRIEELPSTNSYVGNTRLKSEFVQRCRSEESGPLLWIDVDGSIYQRPDLLTTLDGHDMAARRRRQVNEYGYTWHVGTLWFAPTAAAQAFVDAWARSDQGTDEMKFDRAWRDVGADTQIYQLPETYFFIYNSTNRWSMPPDTVVAHRISRGELKAQEKRRSREIRAARSAQTGTPT